MQDVSHGTCQAAHSCTEPPPGPERFDLFAALTRVASDWFDDMPSESRASGADLEGAFRAVAGLAAAEVLRC